jgi:hypothetical protein
MLRASNAYAGPDEVREAQDSLVAAVTWARSDLPVLRHDPGAWRVRKRVDAYIRMRKPQATT